MFFIGLGFCGGNHCADATPSYMAEIKKVEMRNCILDEFYLSKNVSYREDTLIPAKSKWDFDTILHALFEGNLYGGNVDFTADMIDYIRLKRRMKGTYNWLTLDNVPISTNEQLKFERTDRYARGNVDYEYAMIPVMSGDVEGNYNINEVHSEFSAIWFMEKDVGYPAELNTEMSIEQIFTTSTVTTLARKYPFVNRYGLANYENGTISATFFQFDDTRCNYTIDESFRYQMLISAFLTNGNPKLIKHWDGRMWLASIVDSMTVEENGHYMNKLQTIHFTTVGNPENITDLYDANLIDVDVERRIF